MKGMKHGWMSGRRAQSVWQVAVAMLLSVLIIGGAGAAEEPKVDLNTATTAELESLPGVGPAKAQAIVAHRDVAPFKSADELVEVKGIGEKLYAQLKDRVTVSGAPAARKQGGAGEVGAGDGKGGRAAAAPARP